MYNIYPGKNGKLLWRSCDFSRYWTATSRNYPSSLSSLHFFIKSSLNWKVSFIQSKLFTGSFCDIAQPYKLFTCQHWIYCDYIFSSQSLMYLLLASFITSVGKWHIPPLLAFFTINNISISLKRFNFSLVFFNPLFTYGTF